VGCFKISIIVVCNDQQELLGMGVLAAGREEEGSWPSGLWWRMEQPRRSCLAGIKHHFVPCKWLCCGERETFPLSVPSPRSQCCVSQHEAAAPASGCRHWEVDAWAPPEPHNCSGVVHSSFCQSDDSLSSVFVVCLFLLVISRGVA